MKRFRIGTLMLLIVIAALSIRCLARRVPRKMKSVAYNTVLADATRLLVNRGFTVQRVIHS